MREQKKSLLWPASHLQWLFTFLMVVGLQAGTSSPGAAAEDEPLVLDGFTEYWEWSRNEPPTYPRKAVRNQTSGYVKVRFTITSKGKARDIEIVESVPEGIFDRSTVTAVKRMRFRPTASNSDRQPVRVPFTLKFDFPGNGR